MRLFFTDMIEFQRVHKIRVYLIQEKGNSSFFFIVSRQKWTFIPPTDEQLIVSADPEFLKRKINYLCKKVHRENPDRHIFFDGDESWEPCNQRGAASGGALSDAGHQATYPAVAPPGNDHPAGIAA